MKNDIAYLDFKQSDVADTNLEDVNDETMKDSIKEFDLYSLNEIRYLTLQLILTIILKQKKIPKIYGFMLNKNNICIAEKYKSNRKIDLLNYQQHSKHLIFYQTKNNLKSLINKPYLIIRNTNIPEKKCIEYIESLFDSYTNISFISSYNFIQLIIIGQINDDIFSENNIKKRRTEKKYVFNKIIFILNFEYYWSQYNNGKTIAKLSLKINFPDNNRYSSYFGLHIGKYINMYMMKNYDCNKIIRDLRNKYKKFVYVNESKRKYNLFSIFHFEQRKTRNYYDLNNIVEKEIEQRDIEQIQNNQSFYEDYDNFVDQLSSKNTEDF